MPDTGVVERRCVDVEQHERGGQQRVDVDLLAVGAEVGGAAVGEAAETGPKSIGPAVLAPSRGSAIVIRSGVG